MSKKLISVLRKIVSVPIFEIPKQEYDSEIGNYFKDSPELIDLLQRQANVYTDYLGGKEHCISTGNVMFRYVVNEAKKHIYIVGIIAKQGKVLAQDIIDIKGVMVDFANKLIEGWVIYASVNSNSRSFINRLKKLAEQKGTEGKKIFEKSFGKVGFLDKPDFSFDTIAIGMDKDMLKRPLSED